MQQIEQLAELEPEAQRRVVVETLATLGSQGQDVAEVAHDARNHGHGSRPLTAIYWKSRVFSLSRSPITAGELRLVAAASRRLVEKLTGLDSDECIGRLDICARRCGPVRCVENSRAPSKPPLEKRTRTFNQEPGR